MSTFSTVLSALGLAPKTLPQAKETIDGAKATLDSVAALFTAAGLNLETMLASGSDSLKAHLESIDNSTELAEALQAEAQLSQQLQDAEAQVLTINSQLSALNSVVATIGLTPTPTLKAEDITAAFSTHISKATTLALAKTGHPPAHVPAAANIDDVTPQKTEEGAAAAKALTDYEALIIADNATKTKASTAARTEFYAQNHALISLALRNRRRQ